MIIKYSESPIEKIITPTEEDTEKFQKKIKEATNEEELRKEASKEGEPFWIKK